MLDSEVEVVVGFSMRGINFSWSVYLRTLLAVNGPRYTKGNAGPVQQSTPRRGEAGLISGHHASVFIALGADAVFSVAV